MLQAVVLWSRKKFQFTEQGEVSAWRQPHYSVMSQICTSEFDVCLSLQTSFLLFILKNSISRSYRMSQRQFAIIESNTFVSVTTSSNSLLLYKANFVQKHCSVQP
jgi:hypothetical protein